jgi:2-succinyl-5-enolpyruvyl-6-hydroxy-3-cyclohexene-1-carboxylate synthase
VDTTNRNTAVASALVEELARCGVRHACVSPGSRSTPLAIALWRQPSIETTVHVDERSSGFFALGAAQASGRPVAVLTTSGSAAANVHPAVVEADEAGIPLLVLTADRPPELRGIGAGQTIDQVKLYGSAVRWFCELGVQEADDPGLLHARSTACRAYAAARGEPTPGPVHVNVPFRDPLAPLAVEGDVTATDPLALKGREDRPLTAVTGGRAAPDEALLDELADRLVSSPRGLIVAGRHPEPGIAAAVTSLAAAAGYPILAEPTSQLRCGTHDLTRVVWPYDTIARTAPAALSPELVLRVGDMPTSKPLRAWIEGLDGLRQIVVDAQCRWNEPSRRAETVVRADIASVAWGIAERIEGRAETAWSDSWLGAAEATSQAIDAGLAALEEPSEPGLQRALADHYTEGSVIYTASSMPIRDQEAFLPAIPRDLRFLCNRGANGIDGLVSSGIGSAVVSGRPAYLVLGDLALYHDMNGLLGLRHAKGPVRIVVPQNDGGGIFHFLPQAESVEEFEELFGTPTGLDLAKIADLYGLEHRRVEGLEALGEALTPERALVEVPVDRRRNVEIHRELAEAAAKALGAAVG